MINSNKKNHTKTKKKIKQARPVISGKKFAANSWIHLYDYEIPNLWGCTGTFDVL